MEAYLKELGFIHECGDWVLDLKEIGVDLQLFAEINMYPHPHKGKIRMLKVKTSAGKVFTCPLLREKNLEEFRQELENFVKEETLRLLKGEE